MSREIPQVGQADYAVPAAAAQWQKRWLIVGVVGAVLCVIGAVTSLDQFLRGYLIAYIFWLGLSLGCLALLMVQYLSGGLWGLVLRRVFEAASKVPSADVRVVSADPVRTAPPLRLDDRPGADRAQ